MKKAKKSVKGIKAIRKWWRGKKNKPITWGDYATYCKWSLGILGIFYAVLFVWYKIHEYRINHTKEEKLETTEAFD